MDSYYGQFLGTVLMSVLVGSSYGQFCEGLQAIPCAHSSRGPTDQDQPVHI